MRSYLVTAKVHEPYHPERFDTDQAFGMHPDLCKQAIEKRNKGKVLSDIQIQDLTPETTPWDERQEVVLKKKPLVKKMDMAETWNRELAR